MHRPHSSLGMEDMGMWGHGDMALAPRLPPFLILPTSAPRVAKQELMQNCWCQPQMGFLLAPKKSYFPDTPPNFSSFSQADGMGLGPLQPHTSPPVHASHLIASCGHHLGSQILPSPLPGGQPRSHSSPEAIGVTKAIQRFK